MTAVEIRGIHARVEGRDVWQAESRHGQQAMRVAIQAAVAAAVHELAEPAPRSFADRVRELHTAGLCDALIAAETGRVKASVGDTRRALGLPPNRCHRSGGRRG